MVLSRTVCLAAMLVGLAAAPAHGSMFVVNDLGDAGDASEDGVCATAASKCTLRAAVDEANRVADARIDFSVAGTIAPASALEATSTVIVDGSTAPEFAVGAPSVTIDPTGTPAACLALAGSSSVVRGLHVHGGCETGILATGSSIRIVGNVVGLGVGGAQASGEPLTTGVVAGPSGLVGGSSVADRNVISGVTGAGVRMSSGRVTGNFIGTDSAGTGAVGNGIGVEMVGLGTLGGSTPADGNVISGNLGDGVVVAGPGGAGTIQNNVIGVSADGSAALGNGGDGIETAPGRPVNLVANAIAANAGYGARLNGASNVSNNRLGSNTTGTVKVPNTLGHVFLSSGGGFAGIRNNVFEGGPVGVALGSGATGVRILSNTFSGTSLAIDLNNDGRSANDPGDGDGGANQTQNFPVITGVTAAAGETEVAVSLETNPNVNNVDIEVLFNGVPAGQPHGPVNVDGSGTATVTATVPAAAPDGTQVNVTATGPSGTSELSDPVTVGQTTTGGGAGTNPTPPGTPAPPDDGKRFDLYPHTINETAVFVYGFDPPALVLTRGVERASQLRTVVWNAKASTRLSLASTLRLESVPPPLLGGRCLVNPCAVPPLAPGKHLDSVAVGRFDPSEIGHGRSVRITATVPCLAAVESDCSNNVETRDFVVVSEPDSHINLEDLLRQLRDDELDRIAGRSAAGKPPAPPKAASAAAARDKPSAVRVAVLRVRGGVRGFSGQPPIDAPTAGISRRRQSQRSCQWLAHAAKARFRRIPARGKVCHRPLWLRARGTRRWTLRLGRKLPRGRYIVYSAALSKGGGYEISFDKKDGNRVEVRVR